MLGVRSKCKMKKISLNLHNKKNYFQFSESPARQCCGSGSASASNKNTDPDPHPDPHKSEKVDPEPDPNPHQFAEYNPKCMEYEPILALFQGFQPLFGS